MEFKYTPKKTCSTKITFDLDSANIIRDIRFTDGCDGNLKGIAALAEGMDAAELVKKFRGMRCGKKNTSCPDQLAQAIEKAINISVINAGSEPRAYDLGGL